MPWGISLFFSLLTRRCCCEWKLGEVQGRCVEKNNRAVTHEHLSVSQFLIEQASRTEHTHTFGSETLWSPSLFLCPSFPFCLSLTLWFHLSSHSPLASAVNSLDLENVWCHDFFWWKRTCSSLLKRITHHRCPTETFYLSFSETKKAC